jgi:hypothetical protein
LTFSRALVEGSKLSGVRTARARSAPAERNENLAAEKPSSSSSKLLQLPTVNFLGKILLSSLVALVDSRSIHMIQSLSGHVTNVIHTPMDPFTFFFARRYAVDFQNGYMIVLEKLSSARAGSEA